jgi:hypothetical protein
MALAKRQTFSLENEASTLQAPVRNGAFPTGKPTENRSLDKLH